MLYMFNMYYTYMYYITLRLKLALCSLDQVSTVVHDVQLDASEAQSGVDNVGGSVTAEDAAGHDNSEQPTRRSASRAERPTAEWEHQVPKTPESNY